MKELKITSWSLSTLSAYEQCPWKLYKDKTRTTPKQPSFALEYGIEVHSKMEYFLKGEIEGIPPELKKFSTELRNLKKFGAIAEEQLVLDSNWKPVKNWFSSTAWLRAKTDARIDNLVIDLKTGRHYPEHEDQADLYSIIVMDHYPTFEVVDVEFWYSKTGQTATYEFYQDTLEMRREKWESRAQKLFDETEWLPTKNQWCKYCEYKPDCELFK